MTYSYAQEHHRNDNRCYKDESRQMVLTMNITKIKVIAVDNTPIDVNNVLLENVEGYV